MDRTGNTFMLALAMSLSGPASAQTQTQNPPAVTDASREKSPAASKFVIETDGLPSRADGASPAFTNGQVHNFGGFLQDYAARGNPGSINDFKAPFGANLVRPLAGGKVELFGGYGGIFVPFQSYFTRQNTWLTQASGGARMAIDQDRHFWVGATFYRLTNVAEKNRNWSSATADFTVRFGRQRPAAAPSGKTPSNGPAGHP